jgi:hypothetical protein
VPFAFPSIRFKQKLRPSQREVVEIAKKELAQGRKRLHIVAPPGSGKTVLGLYLWAECVKKAAVVLSPNSAIQAQWAARIDLFDHESPVEELVSSDPAAPALLTSLTYQSVTMAGRGGEDADQAAEELWRERLIAKGQAEDPAEAQVWIEDLKRHNRAYYEDRLTSYRKQIRDTAAMGGKSLATLHASSLALLERLRGRGVGLIILDECHHLLGHWGRVLADAHELLEEPIIVGLTATPPDRRGKPPEDVKRYDNFFGPVNYEVPVPAVVKDGFLAPYQDLAYFVRPTAEELAFLASADAELEKVVEELCEPTEDEIRARDLAALVANAAAKKAGGSHRITPLGRAATPAPATSEEPTSEPEEEDDEAPPHRESLPAWLVRVLAQRALPTGRMKDWAAFERRDPQFALAARRFLAWRGVELPEDVPPLDDAETAADVSPAKTPAKEAKRTPGHPPRARQPAKVEGLPEMNVLTPVLDRYIRHRLRRSPDPEDHAQSERAIQRLRMLGIQVTETGTQACASPVGRVMAYARGKTLALLPILKAEKRILGDKLRAVVVTDFEKTSAVTAEVSHLLDAEAGGAISAFRTILSDPETDALDPILVTGSSVLIDDDLSERFMERAKAWLAQRQFDVQLSFSQDDGFHVIAGRGGDWCPRVYVTMITELFQEGFTRCLVGTRGLLGEGWDANKANVLVDLTTVTTSMSVNQLRGRSIRLDPGEPEKLADNWDVVCLAPEFSKGLDDYERFIEKHLTLYGVTEDGAVEKGVGHVHAALTEIRPEGLEGSVQVLNAEMLDRVERRREFRDLWEIGKPYRLEPLRALEVRGKEPAGMPPFAGHRDPWNRRSLALAVGQAVLEALLEAGLVSATDARVQAGERSGGYVRIFLENAPEADTELYTQCVHEALGPLHRPRYVIERYVDHERETWVSRLLPRFVGRYFQKRERGLAMLHAVPSPLAKNKELVAVFERHWNERVSPGEAFFAQRGDGEERVAAARRAGQVSRAVVHEKEIFR